MCLVGVHALECIDPLGIRRQLPVALGDVGRVQVGPLLVELSAGCLDVCDHVVIGGARSLLKVADEAVAGLGVHQVDSHQEGRHGELRANAQGARHRTGLKHAEADDRAARRGASGSGARRRRRNQAPPRTTRARSSARLARMASGHAACSLSES
eukprot:scaffold126933_cov39-Tisochrysis_lutea.AAC.3